MALSRTDVGAKASTTGTTITSNAFTPANNSVIVVVQHVLDNPVAPDTLGMSGGGLTWTKKLDFSETNLGVHRGAWWVAEVGTGASMTVAGTCTGGGANIEQELHIFTYTGYQVGNPTGATGTLSVTTTGTQTLTLSAAPASSSEVLGASCADTGGGVHDDTAGSGFSQRFSTSDGVNTQTLSESRTGSTSTAVTYGATTSNVSAFIAIEIKALTLLVVAP